MFNLLKIENAGSNQPSPAFYETAENEAIHIGEALVLTNGKLTKCGATVRPDFISMTELSATAENRKIAVCRTAVNQLYEVPVTSAPTDLMPGDKVTLHDDGLQVTATTANGIITVDNLNGATKAGDKIAVRI